jgi:hypothetical protein
MLNGLRCVAGALVCSQFATANETDLNLAGCTPEELFKQVLIFLSETAIKASYTCTQ